MGKDPFGTVSLAEVVGEERVCAAGPGKPEIVSHTTCAFFLLGFLGLRGRELGRKGYPGKSFSRFALGLILADQFGNQ